MIGCVCAAGALMILVMFFMLLAFASGGFQQENRVRTRCCGVSPRSVVPVKDIEIGTEFDTIASVTREKPSTV